MRKYCPLLLVALAFIVVSSCSDDNYCVEPETPKSTLSVSINDVIKTQNQDIPNLPPCYYPYIRIDKLPEDEKILEVKTFYSHTNTEPDSLDYWYIDFTQGVLDYANSSWDYEEQGPFIWSLNSDDTRFLPGKTYYVRTRVTTDKGVYFTNTKSFDVDEVVAIDDTDVRHIPIVFHLFPSADGKYANKNHLLDQLEYANLVYANAWNLPSDIATDVKVHFDLATTDDDGNVLKEPGFVYEKSVAEFSWNSGLETADKNDIMEYLWNPKRVINVFVCDFSPEVSAMGESEFPYFNQTEIVPIGNIYTQEKIKTMFLALDNNWISNLGDYDTLGHELGHYLGLYHVYDNQAEENDYCDDTPFYDRNYYLENVNEMFMYRLLYGTEDQYFISTNLMDSSYSYVCAITPDQKKKIDYTLKYAYSVPSPYGRDFEQPWAEIKKQLKSSTSSNSKSRIVNRPKCVHCGTIAR